MPEVYLTIVKWMNWVCRPYASEANLDIIGVAESWLTEYVSTSEIALDNFTVYRKDRCKVKLGRGGGVYYCM